MLKVGVSEVDITPAPGLPRAGMPNPQPGQGTGVPLKARTFIFDDGAHQVALISLDLLWLGTPTVAEFRRAITPGTGLAPEAVMLACSHTHWAPHTAAIMEEDTDFDYLDFVRSRLVEGVARAWSGRRPARLKVGRVDASGWNFNRRPIYRTPYGEQVGTQGPCYGPDFVRMEGPADPELRALLIEGTDGAALGGLVNFACHTTLGLDEPLYSADFPGPLTARLAERHGGVFGYVQGACGNIWQVDRSQDRPMFERGTAWTHKMGEALADKAEEALAAGRAVAGDRVRMARQVLKIPQRRVTPEQVACAKWYLEEAPADLDLQELAYRSYGHPWSFWRDWSQVQNPKEDWGERWFAHAIIGMWEWQRRAGTRELVDDVEVQAISVGDVAFAGFPCEYFTEFGLKVKAASPFPDTFVSEVTNGAHGYVPTIEAFAHGGYEPRLGDPSRLIPEAGDLMCETALALLGQIR